MLEVEVHLPTFHVLPPEIDDVVATITALSAFAFSHPAAVLVRVSKLVERVAVVDCGPCERPT